MLLQVPGTNVPLSHMVHIARKIDAARAARGWTVAALAWRPGMEASSLSKSLYGRRALRADDVLRLLYALGVDPSKLYEWLIPGEVLSDLDGRRKSGHEEIPLL